MGPEIGRSRRVWWGHSGGHSGFGVGCQIGIPVFACVTPGAIESSRPGLEHEMRPLL